MYFNILFPWGERLFLPPPPAGAHGNVCVPSMLYFYHCIIMDLESIIKHYINITVLSYTGQSVTNSTLINQGHVQEFVRGGQNLKAFFCFSIFQGQLRK